MNGQNTLTINDLFLVLEQWDEVLPKKVFLAACGGTAVTLYGHRATTLDVDLLIPDPEHYKILIRAIKSIGFNKETGFGYKRTAEPWIFDLFVGQTIFQTDLLDPVQDPDRHKEIRKFRKITLACIKPDDLIISKMFRGTIVDVEDSVALIRKESLDLSTLAGRYKDTAGYYYKPDECKRNLRYLIDELEENKIDATPLREMCELWTP